MRLEFKSLGFSGVLIALNIVLMGLITFTPLAQLTDYLFQYLIVGMIVFGALISGGVYIAKKGIKNRDMGKAGLGTIILQFAYGVFGAGVLTLLPSRLIPAALGITFIATLFIAMIAGIIVYTSGKDFRSWGKYANYIFMAAIGLGFAGTFIAPLVLLTFVLVLVGFFVYLVYEIWKMKAQRAGPYLNGIGIYVAFMGVFVEILQIVVRMLAEE